MSYLQSPADAGPAVNQATAGLHKWPGRRLVQIGGRLPTASQLHQSFVKILSEHLAANKKVSFASQQRSSAVPIMIPSPTDIVELFAFVEVTLIQYATVARHLPGVAAAAAAAAAAKVKPKRANQKEQTKLSSEPAKEDAQVCAVKPKSQEQGTQPEHTATKPCQRQSRDSRTKTTRCS